MCHPPAATHECPQTISALSVQPFGRPEGTFLWISCFIMKMYISCLLSLKQNRPTMQSQNCNWGSVVFSYASSILQGKQEHRLKQNFIFSLVHWKRSLTPRGNTSHAQQYHFFTRPDVRTGLPWKIPLNRAFGDHNSPFCIWGAVMGKFLNSPNWETV